MARFSISDVLLSSGLLVSLLIQPSCTRHVPEGAQQSRESSESGTRVAEENENRSREQAVDKTGPVIASLRADPAEIRAGGLFRLVIEARIAAGWHIYAIDKPAGIAVPSKIHLRLPTCLEETAGWVSDDPPITESQAQGLILVYADKVTFHCPVRVSKDAPKGATSIRCVLEYQACDRFTCRPPEELTLETEVHVQP